MLRSKIEFILLEYTKSLTYKNLDNIIDIDSFLRLDEEICMGIAKSDPHICDPGSRVIKLDPDLVYPYEVEPLWKDELKHLTTYQKRTFLKYYRKVHYAVGGIFLRTHKGYKNKHLSQGAEWTDNAIHFPQLVEYIKTLPFTEIGRVFFFTLDHFSILTEHRDSMYDGLDDNVSEFLWFTIDKNAMRFYIKDDNNVKHYVESTCAWFNDNDRHSSDGVMDATFCLRIDGVFTEEFREKFKCIP